MEQLPSCSEKSLICLAGSSATTIPKFHKGPHEGPQELQSHSNSSSPVGYWLVLQQMGKQQVFMGKSRSFNHKCAIFICETTGKYFFWPPSFRWQLKCIAKLHRIYKVRPPSYQFVSKPHQVMMVISCSPQTGRCSTLTIVMMMMMMNIIITSSHQNIMIVIR